MIGPRITWVFVGVGIIAIVFYAGYQARYVIGGPTLSIKRAQRR